MSRKKFLDCLTGPIVTTLAVLELNALREQASLAMA